ncbi:MAG: ribonuclease HII [Acidobacteriota bacterium]
MHLFDFERKLLKQNFKYICGVDEVGRGAIFGPVVSGAVVLNPEKLNSDINDSKLLSRKKREFLAEIIYKDSLDCSIGWSWNYEIDRINILNATKESMKMAVEGLQIIPDYVLMDGMDPDFLAIKGEGIIKGDRESLSIAAASIIAKVFRDDLMKKFSMVFSRYGLEKNMGYATKDHVNAVKNIGDTFFHRKSFKIK